MLAEPKLQRRAILIGTAVCSVAAWVGCAAKKSGPPVFTIPPEPIRGVFGNTSVPGLQTGRWLSVPFSLARPGKLDITVDWLSTDSWIYVYLTDTECDYATLSGGTCPFLISSEVKDPKPRVLLTEIADAGSYYLIVYNVPRDSSRGIGSDNTETVSVTFGLTVVAGHQEPSSKTVGRSCVTQGRAALPNKELKLTPSELRSFAA
jgi:hypothetical protein